VASHGWSHRRVNRLTPAEFRDEIARSRDILSSLSGKPVIGFRAPNFSILKGCEWAFDILIEEGYRYDSSIFPARKSGSGFSTSIQSITRESGCLVEVPMSPAKVGKFQIPAGGGAWFRLLPYGLTRRALKQADQRREPGVFYIHPWELDSEQPRAAVNVLTRIRHYGGLGRIMPRMERLMREFEFTSIESWLDQHQSAIAA
jgi:polysaccharide deacetylase family protein (PEP-CTERM system associated)